MPQWLWLIAVAVTIGILIEVAVRVFLRSHDIRFSAPRTCRNNYIIPHPYLPFVYKQDSVIDNSEPASYPLHRGSYEFKSVRINRFRFMGEDIPIQKEAGTVRVMCLGSSSIASSIWEVGNPKQYSYPICLKEALDKRMGDYRHEVLNCGMGGWTSAEILINFALHLIDLKPDVVVFYHGLNDLEPSLTTPFVSDYSHSRKNLAAIYGRIKIASYLPNPSWWKSYVCLKRELLGLGNIRHDLLRSVRVKRPGIDNPFMGLDAERRNIRHLIHLCQMNQIQIILSTYTYHLYDGVRDNRKALRFKEGVQEENEMLRELAEQHGLPLVDIAALIPDDDAYFLDTVHFTPLGMQFVADSVSACIADVLMASNGHRHPAPAGR